MLLQLLPKLLNLFFGCHINIFKFRKLHFLVVIEVIEVSASLEVIDVCHADGFLAVRYRR